MTTLIQTDETVKDLYNMSGRIAKRALAKMNVPESASDHYADLIQTIAATLLECRKYGKTGREYVAYAFRAGYNAAVEYIIEHIFKGKRLHEKTIAAERARFRIHYCSLQSAYIQLSKNVSSRQVPRPVETAVMHDEAARQRFWQTVKRRFLEVLAGMRQKADTKGIELQASALCLSCQGYSPIAIALELRIAETHAYQLLRKARRMVAAFLTQSPLMQRMIQARGKLRILRPEELTHSIMNSQESYRVTYPHGQFNVRRRNKRMRVIQNRWCHGRKKQVSATIPVEIGRITAEHVHQASLTVADRMAQLAGTD